MKIKVYTIDCIKCKILEDKLKAKGIDYERVTDLEIMKSEGVDVDGFFPFMKVDDGPIMDYGDAVKFVNKL